jgi:ABC-type nickel/cobalt efflux system permease component RcnA
MQPHIQNGFVLMMLGLTICVPHRWLGHAIIDLRRDVFRMKFSNESRTKKIQSFMCLAIGSLVIIMGLGLITKVIIWKGEKVFFAFREKANW